MKLRILTAAASVLSVALSACTTVPKNPADTTPPKVEIKVRGENGQYTTVSSASIAAGSGKLELMCVVSDPEGVQSIGLGFIGSSDSCTTNSGAVYTGSFSIEGLPQTQYQALQGDSSGKVLTSAPLLATVNAPLSCTVFGNPSQKGTPYGSKFVVTCTGRNWSSNGQTDSSTSKLDVTIK